MRPIAVAVAYTLFAFSAERVQAGPSLGCDAIEGKQDCKPSPNTPDEPKAEKHSLTRAGEFLDAATSTWFRQRKCASCHTGYPYLMARAALGDPQATGIREVRTFFEDRVAAWDKDGKGTGYLQGSGTVKLTEGISEVVALAATLALHDAQSTRKLHPTTRKALERMWELQRQDGAWAWNKTGLAPLEYDDYYGAVYAALGVGHAPEDYALSDAARPGVAKLREYLQKNKPPDVHHKIWLMWASLKFEGLMTPEQRTEFTKELLKLQRDDGGWCLPALGAWKRRDGTFHDKQAPSDGYATGLALYVLRQAGVSPTTNPMKRGIDWLKTNQRVSGRWFTPSLNGGTRHYITHAGTAYAVLALKACE